MIKLFNHPHSNGDLSWKYMDIFIRVILYKTTNVQSIFQLQIVGMLHSFEWTRSLGIHNKQVFNDNETSNGVVSDFHPDDCGWAP